jgi:hypothetical protein
MSEIVPILNQPHDVYKQLPILWVLLIKASWKEIQTASLAATK